MSYWNVPMKKTIRMTHFLLNYPDSPAEIVGHLPMEISRITEFIIDRGAQVVVKIRGRHYRRSNLLQGKLEVPCEIKIKNGWEYR